MKPLGRNNSRYFWRDKTNRVKTEYKEFTKHSKIYRMYLHNKDIRNYTEFKQCSIRSRISEFNGYGNYDITYWKPPRTMFNN